MKCDACDEGFDESQTKVFKGRKVCQTCFAILSGKQGHTPAFPSTASAPPPPRSAAPSSSSSQPQTTRARDRLESEENGETPAEKTAPKPEASPTPVNQRQATQSKGKVEPTQKRRTAANESKTRRVETKIGADRQAAEPKDTEVGNSVNPSHKENQATAKVYGTASSQSALSVKPVNYASRAFIIVAGLALLFGVFFLVQRKALTTIEDNRSMAKVASDNSDTPGRRSDSVKIVEIEGAESLNHEFATTVESKNVTQAEHPTKTTKFTDLRQSQATDNYWTVGSSRQNVLQIEGPPTRKFVRTQTGLETWMYLRYGSGKSKEDYCAVWFRLDSGTVSGWFDPGGSFKARKNKVKSSTN